MGTRVTHILLAGTMFAVLAYWGCKKDLGDEPTESVPISGRGADYLPLTENKTLTGKISGQQLDYDSLGNVVGSHTVNGQDVKGYIGNSVNIGGLISFPLYYYEHDSMVAVSKTYVAKNYQSIIGFWNGQMQVQPTIILPADLQVGLTWIANPSDPVENQVTLKIMDSKSKYTNSVGKTYSNVIKVNSVSLDTANSETLNYKRWIDADIYFARGIGIVEVRLNHYELMANMHVYLGAYYYSFYFRRVSAGTLGMTN